MVTVQVTDDGSPPLSTTNSYTVIVNEVNVAPVLTLPPDATINEQTLYTATATATDSDLPTNTLTFALVSGPVGLTVAPNGAISWTPTEAQGPSTNVVTVQVTDNGSPNLSNTNSFTLIVNEVNVAPVLTLPADATINGQTPYSSAATATDADIPANNLTFALVSGPTGLTVSTNGAIAWTPTGDQVPSTNTVTIRVTDDGSPNLSDTNTYTLIVSVANSNTAPVLTVPLDQTIHATTLLATTATATDSDLPAQTLTFGLVSGPSGLTVSPAGLITWTPADALANTTNVVTVSVTDSGVPPLSDTNSFNVIVVSRPIIRSITVVGGNATLTWSAIAGTSYRVQYNPILMVPSWNDLAGDVTAGGTNAIKVDTTLSGTTNRFYRIRVLP